jgi:hypothetical protein
MKWLRSALLVAAGVLSGCSTLISDTELEGTIAVEVQTRQGAPIQDARLILFRGNQQLEYARSDSLGRVVFRDVARGTYGVFTELQEPVRGLGWLGTGQPEGNVVVPIDIRGGDEFTARVTLLKFGTGTFEAVVRDNDSLPLADIRVVAYTPTAAIEEKRTNAEGIARFENIPFGAFGAYAIVPESIGGPGVAPINRQGMFFDAGHFERRTYTITRCRGTITTRVLDQSNAPVPAYPVALFTSTTFQRTVETNASGLAVFTLVSCGEYFVTAFPKDGFSVTNARGQGFQDGLRITIGASLTPTLRVTRLP